ncbi:MAG: thiol peroxidase [Flavobacteriales bacterium]
MASPSIRGVLPDVGAQAPELRYVKPDRSNASLSELNGQVVVLLSMPSLDTKICAVETRVFNQRAAEIGAHVLALTMDLPMAMKRFCEVEGIANVHMGSDFRFRDLSEKWNAAIAEGPLEATTCRAVWVIDPNGVVRYHEWVVELGNEPDYEAALKAAKELL